MSAPPTIPLAPKEYDPDAINRMMRVLTQYFTQITQDITNTAGSTINKQFNSIGVGVAASGTAGDLKATTVEAITFTGALVGNASTATSAINATNATNLVGSGSVSATATGGAGLIPNLAAFATDATNAHYAVAGKNINIPTDTNLQTWADSLPRCGMYDIYLTVAQGALPVGWWHLELQRHSNDAVGILYHVLTATGLTTGSGIIYTNTRTNASWGGWVQVVTTVQEPASLATNGYQQLASGLIIQWGATASLTAATGGQVTTFPIAFPTACVSVVMSRVTAATATQAESTVSSFNTTSFTASNGGNTNSVFHYIAIGY